LALSWAKEPTPHHSDVFLEDRFYYYPFLDSQIHPSGLLPSDFPTIILYAFLRNLKHFQCLDLVRNVRTVERGRREYGKEKGKEGKLGRQYQSGSVG
jgi:hypothetical protein